jgi:choline kinase
LPQGFSLPSGREKPRETNHALLMGKDVIHEPFGIINADDFYGRESFVLLAEQFEVQLYGVDVRCCVTPNCATLVRGYSIERNGRRRG